MFPTFAGPPRTLLLPGGGEVFFCMFRSTSQTPGEEGKQLRLPAAQALMDTDRCDGKALGRLRHQRAALRLRAHLRQPARELENASLDAPRLVSPLF